MSKKLALLDFDDVLFNTSAFSEESRQAFIASGVSEKKYENFFQKMRNEILTGGRVYHRDEHINLFLKKFIRVDENLLKKNLASVDEKMPDFVYGDTGDFLKRLSSYGWHRIVLTFGNEDWQKMKVFKSGVGAMVEEIVVTDDSSKVSAVKGIFGKYPNFRSVVFIDDNPVRALNSVKDSFPHVRTIQLIRPELEYKRERHAGCDHDCRSLDEVQKILLS